MGESSPSVKFGRPDDLRLFYNPCVAGEARILRNKLTEQELLQLASDTFGDMVKVTVDVDRQRVAAGGALHAQAEELLLQDGSDQADIWGSNYFPGRALGSRLEFSALINIRPAADNPSQQIRSQQIRDRLKAAVEMWVGPA